MTQTATGVAGTSIAAAYTVPSPGEGLNSTANKATWVAVASDVATISTGNVTLGGNKTFSGNVHLAQTKSLVADGTGCTLAGVWSASGNVNFASNVAFDNTGSVAFNAATNANAMFRQLGRSVPRSARVPVADAASKRIGVAAGTSIDYHGKRFQLPTNSSTAPNVIILDHTNAPPEAEETVECIWTRVATVPGAVVFEFRREDATVVAQFVSTLSVSKICIWAEFEYSGGVWRLGANSGQAWDTASFGVVPGASA